MSAASDEPIVGEVVDPGKVFICERGRAAATRAQMDRRGEYGGLVRESDVCPDGKVIAFDRDIIEATINEATCYTPQVGDMWTPDRTVWSLWMRFTPPPTTTIKFTAV